MKKHQLMTIVALSVVLIGAFIGGLAGCEKQSATASQSRQLIIFHAGSLSVPFRELSELFEQEHPGVEVLAEAAGSRDTARKVSDLGRVCDVLGSADYMVVENLLMPDHAIFNIRFATNEMAIAYTAESEMADQINASNWPQILLDDKVHFGRADPNSDPCGYRTVMLFQLAERHFQHEGLASRLEQAHGKRFIRPKETDLLALLEAGAIDYLPIYRSVATQHGLEILELPDEMNLRNAELADLYATATIEVTGKKPGEFITRSGAPIVYSVTIPMNAPSPDLAAEWLELLLSPRGRAVLERHGQGRIVPAICPEIDLIPDSLQSYCVKP